MADVRNYLATLRKSAPFLYSNIPALLVGLLLMCSPRLIVTQIAPLIGENTYLEMVRPIFLSYSMYDLMCFLVSIVVGGYVIRLMVALWSREPAMPSFFREPYQLIKATFAHTVLILVYGFYLSIALLPLALVNSISPTSSEYLFVSLALSIVMFLGGLLIKFGVHVAMAVYASGGSLLKSADIRTVIGITGDSNRVTLTAFLIVAGIELVFFTLIYAVAYFVLTYHPDAYLAWGIWLNVAFYCLSFLQIILVAYVVMTMFLAISLDVAGPQVSDSPDQHEALS